MSESSQFDKAVSDADFLRKIAGDYEYADGIPKPIYDRLHKIAASLSASAPTAKERIAQVRADQAGEPISAEQAAAALSSVAAPADADRLAKIAEYRDGFKEADAITRQWIEWFDGDAVVIPAPEITRKQLLRVARDWQTMYYAVVTVDEVVNDKRRIIDEMYAELEQLRALPSARKANLIPLIKRLQKQRDGLADVLRDIVQRDLLPYATNLKAKAALDQVPTYEQQLRNIAEGVGMTYEELIAAVDSGSAA